MSGFTMRLPPLSSRCLTHVIVFLHVFLGCEKLSQLAEVYFTWVQRGLAHMPISASDLDLVKSSSVHVHSVTSPLLLHPAWRQTVLGTKVVKTPPQQQQQQQLPVITNLTAKSVSTLAYPTSSPFKSDPPAPPSAPPPFPYTSALLPKPDGRCGKGLSLPN